MPQKAKIKDERYQEIKSALENAVDTNDANEILENFADSLETTATGLKLGLRAKAQHYKKQGDRSWEELYDRLYPNRINTLENTLTQFSKNQILDWIMQYIEYPIPNREYIKESLTGGANDRFFEGILATYILQDIQECDELWEKHRKQVHKRADMFNAGLMGFFFTGMLGTIGFTEGLTMFMLAVGIVLLVSIVGIFARISDFKALAEKEAELIVYTEMRVMNKYPKELLNIIHHNHNRWINDQMDDEYKIEYDLEPTEDVDFTLYGLFGYLFNENLSFNQPIPYEDDFLWRWLYKMSGVSLVDVEAWKKLSQSEKEAFRN